MASDDTEQPIRWNIFARELADILACRGYTLWALDNYYPGIHREKVRRLRHSLVVPKHLPVLNPDEIDAVVRFFHLSNEESQKLQAAVMATAVEALLMDRIAPQNALAAAEQVFVLLREALRNGKSVGDEEVGGINAVR